MIGTKPRPFIFIHIPKCAGMSIIRALIPVGTPFGSHLEVQGMETRRLLWITKAKTHAPLQYLDKRVWTEEYFKFAFVRNPWDRAVSQINYLLSKGANPPFTGRNFKENLRIYCAATATVNHHNLGACQLDYLVDHSGKMGMDFIGRFESLEKDFGKVCARLGIRPAPELPHENPTPGKAPYEEFYDKQSREWVRRRFARDIEYFGYEFGQKPAGPSRRRVITKARAKTRR